MFKREEYGPMKSQRKCNDITNANTPPTSSDGGKRYTLSDLHRLTFRIADDERTFNVEAATPEQFQTFVLTVVGELKNVDITRWPLEDRRDLVNALMIHCQRHHYAFPLTELPAETLTEKLTSEHQ